jgi:chromate transporter
MRSEIPPRPLELFFVWVKAAAQGVGGGGSGQLSAYNSLVASRHWFSAEAWAECWGVCQVVPGVNIIAMALLTGSRLTGAMGAAASVTGLVAPSVVVTFLVTIVYAHLQGTPLLHSGLHGLMAAAVAGAFLNGWRLARPVMKASMSQGPLILATAVVVVLTSAVLIRTTQLPVFALLLGGGSVMALTLIVADRAARRPNRV